MGIPEYRGIGRINSYGLLLLKGNLFVILLRGLRETLPFITYGDNGIVEFMRTSILPLMLFFTLFVMMLD